MVIYFQEEEGFPHKELCEASSASITTTLKGKIMRLINKEVKVNTDSFQPEMVVTVAIPIEIMQDSLAFNGEEQLAKEVGQAFLNALKSN